MKNLKDCLVREEIEVVLAAAATQSERDYHIIRTMWRTSMLVSFIVSAVVWPPLLPIGALLGCAFPIPPYFLQRCSGF